MLVANERLPLVSDTYMGRHSEMPARHTSNMPWRSIESGDGELLRVTVGCDSALLRTVGRSPVTGGDGAGSVRVEVRALL